MWAEARRLRHSATQQQVQDTAVAEAKRSQLEWLDCTKDVAVHVACGCVAPSGVAPVVPVDDAEGPAAPEAVDQPAVHLGRECQRG